MLPHAPIASLDTHEVTNQPPPFADIDLWATDTVLREAVSRACGDAHGDRLGAFGRRAGSSEVTEWALEANRVAPVLQTHDHWGRRIDEVRFHPAYHALMALGLEAGIAAAPWDGTQAGEVLHAALTYLLGQAEAGPICPMTMTCAAVPALRAEPSVAADWVPRILAAEYDPDPRPAAAKRGVTVGMAMTEKQGGSDVRSNTTRAEPLGDGLYALTGHKWFCSAPMSDAFLTLAQAGGGVTCFLVPRFLPDGERNAGFRVVRLKDKLGDRANASSEIEYHRALAWRIGPEGRGIATIIRMVSHTRLDCVLGSSATMRAALAQAIWHCRHRTAFQKRLADHATMAAVLADLAIEVEASVQLGFRLAAAFDADDSLARLLTPIAKYRVCKRAPGMVCEAMECLGGAGYVETGPLARLYRQSPLNAIWEGSGNVIALDVLRAMQREPEAVEALHVFLTGATGRIPAYDAWLEGIEFGEAPDARHLVERLGIAAQAAVLIRGDSPAAEAYCRMRMEARAADYGASGAVIDTAGLLSRALPET